MPMCPYLKFLPISLDIVPMSFFVFFRGRYFKKSGHVTFCRLPTENCMRENRYSAAFKF